MTLYALGDHRPALPDDGSAWVAPDANVIGKVTLGRDSSVWFGATLRGDNEPIVLGDGSNIQENSVLHTDPGCPLTIGRDCTIGHKVMLHGCTVEDECLVGMGAIVLNGARIGQGSLIGAGALIPQGKDIPPGSLVVGAPGKVVKHIDAAGLEELRASAAHYRANARMFRDRLTVVS